MTKNLRAVTAAAMIPFAAIGLALAAAEANATPPDGPAWVLYPDGTHDWRWPNGYGHCMSQRATALTKFQQAECREADDMGHSWDLWVRYRK